MLTFLAVACKKKFLLDEYVDEAVGHMEKNAEGKLAITRVELHPKLKFSGDNQPTEKDIEEMHHFAHENCFIANSVKTEVTVAQVSLRFFNRGLRGFHGWRNLFRRSFSHAC